MGMTQQEKQYKKYIRKNILAENGYATYANILGMLDLHITEDPSVIGFMNPKTGEITINADLDADAVSVVIRHEILHNFLEHEKRLLTKLAKSQGLNPDKLDDLSLRKLEQYLYRNQNFNIAGDYEISNRGYTEEDKQTVRNLVLNGQVLRGLVTEDDHPDWVEWSIEDMYDELNRQSRQNPMNQPPPQSPGDEEGPNQPDQSDGPNGPVGPIGQGGQQPKQNNPNSDVQKSIEDLKHELHKAGFTDEQIDDMINKMEKSSSNDSDGDSDSESESTSSGPNYVDPNNFKSNDEIKKDLKDAGLGERDSKRILKKVKAAKDLAEKEAEKDRQAGAKKGEIGYKGDKETQEKERKAREEQIKKEQEELSKQNKNSESDDEDENTKKSDNQSNTNDEDPYKDYEDDYDSSKETIQQRKDRLSKLSKVFSDPAIAAKIDAENRKKIQASRDEKARKEVRRYMTSDAMKFQMNIKRFLNNEFGEDRERTWSRRNRTDFGDSKIIKQGVKIQDVDRPTKPLINVYFDQSGSWSPSDLRAGNQAVSQMSKFVKEGKLEVQIYYFDDELHSSPPTRQGGTRGMPIIENIKKTHPDNVIIMTDSDIFDITEQVTVPGLVWILWKNGEVSENLKDSIHGQKGTEYYNIEVR